MCSVGYLCANFSLPGLAVLDLGPMFATDRRQTDVVRRSSSLNASALRGRWHNNVNSSVVIQTPENKRLKA